MSSPSPSPTPPPPPPALARSLHILFFPLMSPGHIIPATKAAVVFSSRGTKSTVLTTPANAALVRRTIDDSLHRQQATSPVDVLLVPFPSSEARLPPGHESLTFAASREASWRFVASLDALRGPFACLLRQHRPDCVVTDEYLPWTADVAAAAGVPRLVFQTMGFFPLCAIHGLSRLLQPPLPEEDPVLIPGMPRRVEMKRSQLHGSVFSPNWFDEYKAKAEAAERSSIGVVVNSFYELEPEYVDHFRAAMGKKAWHVGPLALPPAEAEGIQGKDGGDGHRCEWRTWLDAKEPSSVVYVCFGTLSRLTLTQLEEIEVGLEASGHSYIWVVHGGSGEEEVAERKEKGMIVRGWAPQAKILNHEAVGAFLTHCGWNSVLEGVWAGVPMLTWPLEAEQFYNERLVVEVLGIGVEVGAEEWGMEEEGKRVIGSGKVAAAVRRVMGGGEEEVGMRRRAAELRGKAMGAVVEGGSSYEDIGRLVGELVAVRQRPEAEV